jgi:ankyrin repeat protein
MVDMLKKAGAKTKDQLIADRSELVRAVSDGNIELVNKLVGNADAEEKDTALIIAVRENMLPMVKCLLVAGANPGTTSGGISMLIWACVGGLTDIVRELIDAGADITFKGEDGMTAMQWAAKGKHRDIVALLLAKAKERKNTNK